LIEMDFQDIQVSSLSDRKPVISRNNFFVDTDFQKEDKEIQESPKPGSAFVGVIYNSAILGENLQPKELVTPSSSHLSKREVTSPLRNTMTADVTEPHPMATETKIEYEFDYKASNRPQNYCPPLMARDSQASLMKNTSHLKGSNVSSFKPDNADANIDVNNTSDAQIKDLSQAEAEIGIGEADKNEEKLNTSEKDESLLFKENDDVPMSSSRRSRSNSVAELRQATDIQNEEKDALVDNVSGRLSSHPISESQIDRASNVQSEDVSYQKNEYQDPENAEDGSQAQPEIGYKMMNEAIQRRRGKPRLQNFSQVAPKNEYPTDFYKNSSYVAVPVTVPVAVKNVKKNAIVPMITNNVPPQKVSQGRVIDLTENSPHAPQYLKTGIELREKNDEEREMSGFEKLLKMEGIVLKQKFHVFKDEDGWLPPYRTYVHTYLPFEGETGKKMFQCNEVSNFCMRQCVSNFCRPFSVVVNVCNPGESPDEHKPFLMLERLCSCGCLWLNRPKISVRWIEDGRNEFLGTVRDSFDWGDIKMEIFDKNDKLRYSIKGSCCQWGLICNCYCKSCQKVSFMVQPAFTDKILQVLKQNTNASKETFPNADRFYLDYSTTSSVEDRALLLSALLFLESRHFEGDA